MITKPLVIGKCLRCGGQLYMEKDYTGNYEKCLQCGYEKDIEEPKPQKSIINFWAKE